MVSDTPHYENVPFEVPEGWVWCRLSEIANYGGGKTPSMDNKQYWSNGTNLWITSKDMKCERITDSMMKISNDALDIMTQYEPGTLLMVTRSGILRHSLPIAILEEKATVNQDLKTISLHFKETHEYVYYAIKARERYILKEYHKDGTTVDSINFEKFAEILLPIPPYDEQKRIVVAIKQWLSFIDQLEQDANDLETSIQQTKTKILELAMHGKLVPQDPNDEPAIELLKRINPKFTPCDNAHYPFDVPNNWIWAKGLDIFKPMKTTFPSGDTFKYIDIDAIDNKRNVVTSVKVLNTKQAPSRASRYTEKGCVLFSMVRPYLRNIAMVTEDDCIASTGFFVCQGKGCLSPKFCYYQMLSNYVVDGLNDFMKGDNSPSITKAQIEEYIFPLPPLNEQKRIVAKIQELFAVLDEIQKSIEA
ncbi:restriction endonuclease subunit S [Prevotella sp. Rep29]|uniref:restriction endonuclease subunit S n=1 Tax=Prevotella sp. Rep29 TaxID=2691580 RepID=UPI001C6F2294|nr:restriction endonuclease subunit S [Prevotella sp. Rep29]QYR09878.1 restriction endonuclease subunit S [Prevotella sp. Rep29]